MYQKTDWMNTEVTVTQAGEYPQIASELLGPKMKVRLKIQYPHWSFEIILDCYSEVTMREL